MESLLEQIPRKLQLIVFSVGRAQSLHRSDKHFQLFCSNSMLNSWLRSQVDFYPFSQGLYIQQTISDHFHLDQMFCCLCQLVAVFARLDFVGLVAVIGFVAVAQRMMRLIVVVVDRQWKNLLMAVELLLKPLCLFLDLEKIFFLFRFELGFNFDSTIFCGCEP